MGVKLIWNSSSHTWCVCSKAPNQHKSFKNLFNSSKTAIDGPWTKMRAVRTTPISKQKCKNLHLLKNSYTLGTQKPIQFTNWFTQKTLYLGHTQQTHNFKIQELYYTTNISNKNISNAKTYFIHKCKWYMKEISNLNIF